MAPPTSPTPLNGVSVWNPENGEQVAHLELKSPVSLEMTSDGDKLLVGDGGGRCFVYDAYHWQLLYDMKAHVAAVKAIQANPTEATFASGGADGIIHIWDLENGTKITTLLGHDASVNSLAWDPTGKELVSVGHDQTVKVWSISRSSRFQRVSAEPKTDITWEAPRASMWEADSNHLLCFYEDGAIGRVDIKSERLEKVSTKRIGIDGSFNDDASKDAAIAEYIRCFNQQSETKPTQFLRKIVIGNPRKHLGLCWSGDGNLLVSVTHRQILGSEVEPWKIEVWDASNSKRLHQWNEQWNPQDIRWAPDHRRFAVASRGGVNDHFLHLKGCVFVFDSETGRIIHKLQHGIDNEEATAVAWAPDGLRLVSGNKMGLLCIWDAGTGKQVASQVVHNSRVSSLAWSPDGKRIASDASAGEVKIIEAETAIELLQINDGGSSMQQLSWSPDGRKLAGMESNGRSVVFWDASQGFEYVLSKVYSQESLYKNVKEANEAIAQGNLELGMQLLNVFSSAVPDDNYLAGSLARRRAEAWMQFDQYESAIAEWTKCLSLDPVSEYAWAMKGLCEGELGRHDEAIHSYTKAIEFCKSGDAFLAQTYFNRGNKYSILCRPEMAAVDFKNAIEQNALIEMHGIFIGSLGYEQIRLGLTEKAIETLKTGIAKSADNAKLAEYLRKFLGAAYVLDGQVVTGIRELETLSQKTPFDSHSALLSAAYLWTGNVDLYKDQSIDLMNRLSPTSSDEKIKWTATICTLAPHALSDYSALIQAAQAAVARKPDDQGYRLNLWKLLMRAGRYEEAKVEMDKDLDAPYELGQSIAPYFYRAILYKRLGDHQNALKQLEFVQQQVQELKHPQPDRIFEYAILGKEAQEVVNGSGSKQTK